jgi:hypothetical protein
MALVFDAREGKRKILGRIWAFQNRQPKQGPLSDEQTAYLAAALEWKTAGAIVPEGAAQDPGPGEPDLPPASEPPAEAGAALPPTEDDTEVVDTPPLPPPPKPPRTPRAAPPPADAPPKVKTKRSGSPGASGWQSKYRVKIGDTEVEGGREATCVEIAKLWVGLEMGLVEIFKKAGIEPWIDPMAHASAKVLAVDELLPDDLEVTPAQMAIATSAILCGQAIVNWKAVGAQLKANKQGGSPSAAPKPTIAAIKANAEAETKIERERKAAQTASAKPPAAPAPASEAPPAPTNGAAARPPIIIPPLADFDPEDRTLVY